MAFDLHEIIYADGALPTAATPAPSPPTHVAYWPTNNPTPAPFSLWMASSTIWPQAAGTRPPSKSADAWCADGIAGIRFGDVCCVEKCGTCGGTGCATVGGSYHGADECCAAAIMESGVSCNDSRAAPCMLIRGETQVTVVSCEETCLLIRGEIMKNANLFS